MDTPIQNPNATAVFRLFIALPVPEVVKVQIQQVQEELRRELPKSCARWTRPEQWHLTLKFLGNVDAARVTALTDTVGTGCDTFGPLKLRAERIGCFPDLRFPRVVWAWVHDEQDHLARLTKAIEDATAAFAAERSEATFTGHITIARTQNIKRPQAELLAKLAHRMTKRVFGEWTADAVEIMKSELATDGPKHTCLARLLLKKNT